MILIYNATIFILERMKILIYLIYIAQCFDVAAYLLKKLSTAHEILKFFLFIYDFLSTNVIIFDLILR